METEWEGRGSTIKLGKAFYADRKSALWWRVNCRSNVLWSALSNGAETKSRHPILRDGISKTFA
jgi:hypothetical protein